MPRIHGVRERRHQPIYDTLIRTTGDPSTDLPSSKKIFGNANVGDTALTNLTTAGQLSSDKTYVVLAIRCYLFFEGTNARKNYQQVSSQLWLTLTMGDKPQFQAPAYYFPAGGGVYGSGANSNDDPVYSNGIPSQDAILKLARPIIVPVRQNFNCNMEFFTTGTTDARDTLNNGATDDQKIIMVMLDGMETRDVQ